MSTWITPYAILNGRHFCKVHRPEGVYLVGKGGLPDRHVTFIQRMRKEIPLLQYNSRAPQFILMVQGNHGAEPVTVDNSSLRVGQIETEATWQA